MTALHPSSLTDIPVSYTKGEDREDRAALDTLLLLRQLLAVAVGSDCCDLCGCLCAPWETACPACRPVLQVQPMTHTAENDAPREGRPVQGCMVCATYRHENRACLAHRVIPPAKGVS